MAKQTRDFNTGLYNASRMTIPEDGTRGAFVVIGDPRNWNFFCATESTADDVKAAEVKTKSVKGHQRRRGPSDNAPSNVAQSNANYLVDPSLKSGNALPGVGFRLKTTPNADIEEQRSFQLVGRTQDLQQYLAGNVNYPTYIYFENGGRHTVRPTVGEG